MTSHDLNVTKISLRNLTYDELQNSNSFYFRNNLKVILRIPIIFWKRTNESLIGNHDNIFSGIWYFASNIYFMLGCIKGCVNIFCFFYIFYTLSLRRQFASYLYYSHIIIKKSWGMKNKSGVYLVAFYASNGTKCFAVVLFRDIVEPLKHFVKIIWNLTK